MTVEIKLDAAVEDVVQAYPDAVTYLLDRGIRVICCGAPVWATMRQLAETHGVDPHELVQGLSRYLANSTP